MPVRAEEEVPKLLTVREVATTLRMSKRTVLRYIAAGEFPNVRETRRRLLIPATDVTAYLERIRRS